MRKLFVSIALLVVTVGLGGQAPPDRYTAGQVWAYRTRPGDEGSLLKIQSVENYPEFGATGLVYHISIVGFQLGSPRISGVLAHAPVTRNVLDRSVTVRSASKETFPDATPGIVEWRRAKGGVFTISVAEIVELIDQQAAASGE